MKIVGMPVLQCPQCVSMSLCLPLLTVGTLIEHCYTQYSGMCWCGNLKLWDVCVCVCVYVVCVEGGGEGRLGCKTLTV